MLSEEVEQQGKKWKQYGYTRKGLSYEMFYRSEGAEVANSLYPQRYKNTGSIATVGTIANARAEARHDAIHEICIFVYFSTHFMFLRKLY